MLPQAVVEALPSLAPTKCGQKDEECRECYIWQKDEECRECYISQKDEECRECYTRPWWAPPPPSGQQGNRQSLARYPVQPKKTRNVGSAT